MDRTAFIQGCSDLSLLAGVIRRPESAERFAAMAADAKRTFWWNPKEATARFYEALRAMFQEKEAA